jgi:hypothetical protein
MDDATLDYLRSTVGDAAGIPPSVRHRLHGETLQELQQDAKAMRRELGLDPAPPPRARSTDGRFATMNQAIRNAAGRR